MCKVYYNDGERTYGYERSTTELPTNKLSFSGRHGVYRLAS